MALAHLTAPLTEYKMAININLNKAKEIAHQKRRTARAEEFKPHDEVIAKQVPGGAVDQAEAARQVIRAKYVVLQEQMDSAQDVEQLKASLPKE